MKKRILSMLLALMMVVGMLPVSTLTASAATLSEITNLHRGVLADCESPDMVYWDAVNGVTQYEVMVTGPSGTVTTYYTSDSQVEWTTRFWYPQAVDSGTYSVSVTGGYEYGDRFIYETNTATINFEARYQYTRNYSIENIVSVVRGEDLIRTLSEDGEPRDLLEDLLGNILDSIDYALDKNNGYPIMTLIDAPSWAMIYSSEDHKDNYLNLAPPSTCEAGTYTFYLAVATSDVDGLLLPINVKVGGYRGSEDQLWIQNLAFDRPPTPLYFEIWEGTPWYEEIIASDLQMIQGSTGDVFIGEELLTYLSHDNFSIRLENADGEKIEVNSVIDVGKYRYRYRVVETGITGTHILFDENMKVYLNGEEVDVVVEDQNDLLTGDKYFTFYSPWYYVYDEKPEIKTVLVNGESVADGATYVSNSKSVTVKTTYDSELSQALQDYGCTVKYKTSLNGVDYSNVSPSTSNGNGTSTQTYVQNVNSGSSLTFKSWLEVTWPDGSKDVVDERTTNVTYGGVKSVSVSATFSGTPANATSNTSGIKVNETRWFKVNDNGSMTRLDSSDTIAEGGTYRVYAYLAEDGDKLADGYTVKINGQPATHSPSNGANTWYIEVILTGTNDYIDVEAIGLPEAYTNPVFTYDTSDVAPSRKHWDVVQVEWFECDKDGHKLSDALPADYIFLTDSYYRVEVTVTPESNWQFHSSDLGFYINGKAAQYVYYYNSDYSNSVTGYAVYNTADIEGSYELYVYDGSLSGSAKDIYIKDGQYLGSDATAPSDTKPASGGYAYYKDGVLELNGYDNEKAHFIFEELALELWLIGDNTLGAIYDNEWGMAGGNLETRQGNLVINANPGGTLVIASNPLDAYANIQVKDLYFKGGDVTSCLANGTYGAAVQLNDGNLYLEKGTAAYVSDSSNFSTATKWDGTTNIGTYDNVWLKTVGTCRVEFLDDDNTVLVMVRVTEGSSVSEPDAPVKEGYEFIGWYTDDGDKFDFTTPITEDICLTARYEQLTVISEVNITVTAPAVGATLNKSVACTTEGIDDAYLMTSWYDVATSTYLTDGATFEAGKQYGVDVSTVRAKDGYVLANDVVVKINGKTASKLMQGVYRIEFDALPGNSGSNITVNCIGDIDYTVSGNVVTVDHEVACKVGYLDGTAYKAITAVANGDGTYSFTAPAGVTEVLLVVKGDINGDGEISLADSTRTKAAYNKKTTPTAEAAFAADANGDGEITLADSTRIKAAYNKKTTLSW